MTALDKVLIASLPLAGNYKVLAADYSVQHVDECHTDALARLRLEAYGPAIASDMNTSLKEMRDMFDDQFGSLWVEASPLIFTEEKLVGACCTVVHPPNWPKTPICPFIIDLMVQPKFRRNGLAEYLILMTAKSVARTANHIALRVSLDNHPALSLYRKLGFIEWDGVLYAVNQDLEPDS